MSLKYKIIKSTISRKDTMYTLSVFDDEAPKIELYNIRRSHATNLSEVKLANRLQGQIERHHVNAQEPAFVSEKVYTELEVSAILIDKKYITEGETIDDLAVKATVEVSK